MGDSTLETAREVPGSKEIHMNRLGNKIKTLLRRKNYLAKRVSNQRGSTRSFDVAEISALRAAIEIMQVYRDALPEEGSRGIYKALDTSSEVLDRLLDSGTVPADLTEKVERALDMCEEGMDLIEGMKGNADAAAAE